MHLFIDTNIFLRFYGYTNDRLEELKKLIALIDSGDLTLFVPSQLIDEISRNRELEIKKTYKDLVNLNLEKGFPYIFRSHPHFSEMIKSLENFKEIKSKILDGLENDIQEKKLGADIAIAELLSKGISIPCESFIELAKLRILFGNPPGKEGKLGDAINWESLLATVPNNEDLFLVSKDSDYQSPVNEKQLNGFLLEEWKRRKNSRVYFYQSLMDWASSHQRDILLKLEDEKTTLISRLVQSNSFAETHLLIENLKKHADFSSNQIEELLTAAVFNNQVNWILLDKDVEEFYKMIITGKENEIDKGLLDLFNSEFNKNK